MNRATQKSKLLKHLEENHSITSLEAVQKFFILRPSNRIQELKALGHDIDTEIIYEKKPDGSMTHYARYTLAEA